MEGTVTGSPYRSGFCGVSGFQDSQQIGGSLGPDEVAFPFEAGIPGQVCNRVGDTYEVREEEPFRSEELHDGGAPSNANEVYVVPVDNEGRQADYTVPRVEHGLPTGSDGPKNSKSMPEVVRPLIQKGGAVKVDANGEGNEKLLPRLLKHKGEAEPIPATTVRYANDPFAIADLGETESLTKLQW